MRMLVLLALVPAIACQSRHSPSVGVPASPPPGPLSSEQPQPATPPAPAAISGVWLGTLHAGSKNLRIQVRIDLAKTPPSCALDSIDQHGFGIPCSVTVTRNSRSLDVPDVHGSLVGTISDDGTTMNATWTQGDSLPLVLVRRPIAIEPPEQTFDEGMPPVDVANLKDVLDKDLETALASGDLAPGTGAGITVGVVQHGVRRILAYGTTKADAVFEIGSITKTFTGLLLAQLAEQKKVRLDEPIRALLPPGTVAAPASGPEITLLDLSTHRSGLPRMPDNFKPADPNNEFADYDKKALYAFIASHGVAAPAKPVYLYSNVGAGLLGQLLADRAGTSYEALLHKEVTGPLGMRDTVITMSPALRARFASGHDASHQAVPAWDFDALVGAGGIHSTADDMLTYLEAQLHPDHLPPAVRSTPEGKTLAAAIAASHVVRGEVGEGAHIALGWNRIDESGSYWHGGLTGGYNAFAVFKPENDFAVVVLSNTAAGAWSFAEAVGAHVCLRLLGKPAFSLGPPPR